MASKSRETISSTTTLMSVRNYLSRNLPSGTTVDLRVIAKEHDLPPYVLIPLVKRWIATGELKGIVSGHKYTSYGTEAEYM